MADVRFSFITHCCVFVCSLFVFAQSLDLSCIEVKKEYIKMGFPDRNIPLSFTTGDHLQICPTGNTCCTPDMEEKFKSMSMKEYENVGSQAFKVMKSTFMSRTKKFDEFFTELLEKSKKDLHSMFVRTYGLLYQQNSEMFSNLFRDLKLYYKGSNLDLVEILNKFFVQLLQRMFELLNAQYVFDNDYLKCVTRHMDDLKPFKDIPKNLKLQVKRAFVAARTFVQGLAIGRDVILAMERVKPTEKCTAGMTRMMFCPHCQALTRTKPCNNYCLNTMKGCLAHHSELNKAWNEYIEALKMVAMRLEGSFNIETVVDPIDVTISEAIMNFQEDATTVTERIFKGCGTPRRAPKDDTRFKRAQSDKDNGESYTSYEDYAYGKNFLNNQGGNSNERPETAAGTNLDRLIKDIKEKVQEAKDFWVQLPYSICNGEIAAQPGEENDCWNGKDRARYVQEVQKDGRIYQVNNPEVEVNVQEDNGIISVQIYNLKLITGKLQNAYNGIEVEGSNVDIDIDTAAVASGDDDLETSGNGDLESSGQQSNIEPNYMSPVVPDSTDDEDLYSGSGSGDRVGDDEEYNKGRPGKGKPGGTRPGVRPGIRPGNNGNTRPNHRPSKPTNPNGDIDFNNNPKYDITRTPKPRPNKNTKPTDGASPMAISVLLLSLCVTVIRVVL